MTARAVGQHTVFAVEPIEDVDKQFVDDIHDLIIVLVDGHLKIKPGKLTKVAVCEGVLCPVCKLTTYCMCFDDSLPNFLWSQSAALALLMMLF